MKGYLSSLLQPNVTVEKSFGLDGPVIKQDSLVVLDFDHKAARRLLKGKENIILETDTLDTSRPGEYRIIYETKDTSYFRDIIILPKLDSLEPKEEVINELDQSAGDSEIVETHETTDPTASTIQENGSEDAPNSVVNTPIKPTFDCQVLKKDFSDKCDDGNPNTYNDRILDNCSCQGTPRQTFKWYADKDGDQMGDPNKMEITYTNSPPDETGWAKTATDKCPDRPAVGSGDGCPSLTIKVIEEKLFLDKQFQVSASSHGLLPADKITWIGSESINFSETEGLSTFATATSVGYHTLKYIVVNDANPLLSEGIVKVHVGISPERVKDIIKPIIVQGSSKGQGNFESQSQKAMRELFLHTVSKRITVEDETGSQLDPLETFLTSDVKLGLPKGKYDLEILDIGYDMKGSGKIDYIQIKFL